LDDETNETKSRTEPKKKGEETNPLLQEHDVPWHNILLGEGVLSFSFGELLSGGGAKTLLSVGLEFLSEGWNTDSVVCPGTDSLST
jgi:hypothetical protein